MSQSRSCSIAIRLHGWVMLRMMLGWLVAILIAGSANAAPTAETRELARRYVASLQIDKTLRTIVDATMPKLQEGRVDGKRPSPEQAAAFRDAAQETMKVYSDLLQEKMTPLVADIFTLEELRDLIAFQESSTGKALAAKSPIVSSALQVTMKDVSPALAADMLRRYCQKVECEPFGGKAVKPQPS